jgi:hypothetical protein
MGVALAQAAQHFEAVYAGQHQIQDQQVGRVLRSRSQGCFPAASIADSKPLALQPFADDLHDSRLILYYQDRFLSHEPFLWLGL